MTDHEGRYQKLFEMLLEAIPCSVLLIDRDMRILVANRNFLEKSRKERVAATGRRLEALLPQTIIENTGIIGRIRRVFEKNQATHGERMIYRAPGVPMRMYYYSVVPFSWEGNVEQAMLLMEDVTEQLRLSGEVHRAERHLASVVESATDIVASTDSRGRILTWNLAAERLSGRRVEEVRGTPLIYLLKAEDQCKLADIFAGVNVACGPQTGEWDLITKAGKLMTISWVFSPMEDEDGKLVGMVAVGRDLSERRKLEAQLLQSQKLAALGVMAGGIAHEIRNPLGICLAAAQFLAEQNVSSEFRNDCVEKITTSLQKASAIIENLLRFARPAASANMTEVELVQVLGETFELMANQAKLQKVSVSLDLPSQQVLIYGNADLLQQVFLNLFLNAINAMPDGGKLQICVQEHDWNVIIQIADSGHGIPPEHLENVFDPFYTLSAVGKGTGLGLSICYSIVKQHLGRIEVHSSEGEGTVFTISLPLILNRKEALHGKP